MSEINLNDMQSGHHRNPFTVPEGYFDHFADDFMARLDDQPAVVHHSWWHRYRYYVASAACLAGLLLTSTVYLAHTQHQQTKALAEQHALMLLSTRWPTTPCTTRAICMLRCLSIKVYIIKV